MVTIKDIQVFCTAPAGINLVVAKVYTSEDGLFGLGCGTFAYRYAAVKFVIETYVKPLLIGRDVSRITDLWQLMNQNAYWRNGPIVNNAISAIDIALWDIKGKMANMPVYDLLGGKCRDGVALYRHVDGRNFDEVCQKVEAFKSEGIKYLRCELHGSDNKKIGAKPSHAAQGNSRGIFLDNRAYMRETVGLFEGLRDRFGDEVELISDLHERLDPCEAVDFFHQMEGVKPFFIEDPVPVEQLDWIKRLRTTSTIPLAMGELFTNPVEWKGLIRDHDIDFIRVHLSQIGGITPAIKLAAFAGEMGVKICWHGPGDMTPMAHAANVHLDLAFPNFSIQEWGGIEPSKKVQEKLGVGKDILYEVFPGMPQMGGDGFLYASDKPGLGIDFNESLAAKYHCNDGETVWTQTRSLDGSIQWP